MISSLKNNYNYIGLGSIMSSKVFNASPVELTPQNPSVQASDIKVSNVKVRQEQESNYNNNVYFRDSTNNAYVSVGLSDENLQRLQETFGSQSVKKDGSGNVVLQGKAEEFVSSWFNDIAYKRGYINADTNQDGFLDSTERQNTNSFKTGYLDVDIANKNVYFTDTKNYQNLSSDNFSNTWIDKFSSNSIEKELNKMIELDKDADNSVTFNQLWDTNEFTQYLNNRVNSASGSGNNIAAAGIAGFLKQLEESFKSAQIKNQTQSSIPENSTDENSTLKELMELTKLDKETLVHNLKNNPNFEDNIISIVNELTQNVDSRYASNNTSARKSLDIYA